MTVFTPNSIAPIYLLVCYLILSITTRVSAIMQSGRHLRSPLIRTVYNRMVEDERERNMDHSHWYSVNIHNLSADIGSKFVLSSEDKETNDFLDSSYEKSDWVFTQIYHLIAKSALSWFMTNTSINGYLQRGSMFVLSNQQFRRVLDIPDDYRGDKLLDLGAGDGKVTEKFSLHFNEVHATEASSIMTWRLKEKGYQILEIDEWPANKQYYDLVSALNLLDRCDKPLTLLRQIHQVLKPTTGRLLLAVVIPYKPYVEFGRSDHKPTENLHIEGRTFEEQINNLVNLVFKPAGYELQSFTRVPYLCEGDLEHSFYSLDDAVFVLKPI